MILTQICLTAFLFLLPLLGAKSGVLPLAVFSVLLAGGWWGWARANPQPTLQAIPLRWPLGFLMLITLLTTVTSVYRPASVLGCWHILIIAGTVLLASIVPLSRRQLLLGAAVFTTGVLLGEVYGLQGWVSWYAGMHLTNWRVQSTWENANFYAGFLLVSLPLLAVFTRHAPRSWRPLPGITLSLGVLSLLLTQSRGGLLAFFLSLLVLALSWLWVEGKLSARAIGLLVLGLLLLGGMALLSPLGQRVLNPALRAKQLHSQMFRFETWKGTLRMVRARPWQGSGPETYPSAYGAYQYAGYTRQAHQMFLQAAAEMGWPGMLALFWLLGASAVFGYRALQRPLPVSVPQPAPERKPAKPLPTPTFTLPGEALLPATAGAALLAATIGLAVHGLVDSDWMYSGIQLTLLLQTALIWQLARPPAPATPTAAWVRMAPPTLFIIMALNLLPGAYAEQLDTQAQEMSDNNARAAMLREAVTLAPTNAGYLRHASSWVSEAEARGLLIRAMILEPTNAANWLFFGQFALAHGEFAEARKAYRTAEEKQPNLLPALFGEAQACWRLHDDVNARQALDHLLATQGTALDVDRPVEVPEPWYTQAWYARGQLARLNGDRAGAIRAFNNTLEAAAKYMDGYTKEAEAWATFTGDRDKQHVGALASLAHLQLAALLATADPAAAARHRAAVKIDIPSAVRNAPFP